MKKIFFSFFVVLGLLLTASISQAQTLKLGVFDAEYMMQVVPEYKTVDSLLQVFQRDSLGAQYEDLQSEYKRMDSMYKVDSIAGKSKTVLDIQKNQIQQIAFRLVYWQQIAQEQLEYKKNILAYPIYQRVVDAYKKVLDKHKFSLVLKPNTYEPGGTMNIENIFALVAKEMGIPLPPELGGGQQQQPAPAEPKQQPKPATRSPR